MPATLAQALKELQATPQALFKHGEALRVTDGPFRDLQVIFEMHDGDHRAIVLIELLNKMQKIAVNLNALSSARLKQVTCQAYIANNHSDDK